jgi:hypothetical protein
MEVSEELKRLFRVLSPSARKFRSFLSATKLPSYRFRHFLSLETCIFDNQCDQFGALCLVERGTLRPENTIARETQLL